MAQSFVQVPADSVGKKIDTWVTATAAQHRQAVVIGDPSTDANVVTIPSTLKLPVQTEQQLDYDTGAGTANLSLVGLALPASGGPVAGGTVTNPVRTDPTGTTTQPVSGPLTDTQLRASAVPVSGTFFQATQPISAVSLPLPAGASTEATLATRLTEADFDTKVGSLTEAAPATDTASSGLNGRLQRIAQRLTTLISTDFATQTTLLILSGIVTSARAAVNLISGQAGITAGAGAVAANTPRGTLASDDPAVLALQIIDDWDETNRAAVNSIAGQVGVQGGSGVTNALTQRVVLATDVALPAGVNNIGDVDLASAIPAGSNLIGQVNLTPQTGNALDIFRSLDLDETEEAVKATAGAVYGYHFVNRTTAPLYLKFYNDTVANVIVGTTVPVMTLELPANASDHIAGHVFSAHGIGFSVAITVAVTTGFADADTGAPAANAAIVHVFYK